MSRVVLRLIVPIVLVFLMGCGAQPTNEVVVYTSQDQVYSSEILTDFESETGIKVKAVYDSELVKTVGLANRLIAEKDRPRCDVFWSNEPLRAHQLKEEGVFEASAIATFGYRLRQFVFNTEQLSASDLPKSLEDLTQPEWKGKVVMAYPLFGTTSTHLIALREEWGDEKWEQWIDGLLANETKVVDGNSIVVRMVGSGEAVLGLTDSDDIHAGLANGLPIASADYSETLLIPNATAIVKGGPNPTQAEKLVAYLSGESVMDRLIAVHALEGSTSPYGIGLEADWSRLVGRLDEGAEMLKGKFLRD